MVTYLSVLFYYLCILETAFENKYHVCNVYTIIIYNIIVLHFLYFMVKNT